MMLIKLADIEAEARRRSDWFVTVTVSDSRFRLHHPQGRYVEVDITRSDRLMPIKEFGDKRIDPALAFLRDLVAKETA
jgi:hypothetical protein